MPVARLAALKVFHHITSETDNQMVNTLHFHNENDIDHGEIDAMVAGLAGDSDFTDAWRGILTAAQTLDKFIFGEVPDPAVPGDPVYAKEEDLNLVGTRSAGSESFAPPELCAVMKLQTGIAGRRARGRLFLPPGLISDQLVVDEWFATGTYMESIPALQTQLERFFEGNDHPLYAEGWDLHVYSRAQALASADPVSRAVTNVVTPPKVHFLRRRSA